MGRAPVHQPEQRSAAGGSLRERAVLALFPLSTGAAVAVTILFVPDSLLWPALVLVAGTGLTAATMIWRMRPDARRALGRRARTGLVAGVVATLAYDAVRWLLVVATPWTVDPFAAFPIFGQLLLGTESTGPAVWTAGTLFHAANGLGFAVGYTVVIRRPGLVSAVAWALVLELFTILLYPDWLGVPKIGELFSVSLLGHLAYGLALGLVAIRITGGGGWRHR
ncbi:MAG: hypothetical protein ACRDT2_16385 [Natronosporangium sp.]